MVDVATVASDGRVRRGAENRSALVEALVSLYEEGDLTPTATQIAQRAGVAVRSVYGHFGDVDSLAAEVSKRQWEVYGPLMDAAPVTGTLSERIVELVARRGALYEAIAPVRRAGMLYMHRSPTIAENLRRLTRRQRAQVAQTFAPELAEADAALLDAADLLLSWESWERLRSQQGHSAARARRVLAGALVRLLEPTRE